LASESRTATGCRSESDVWVSASASEIWNFGVCDFVNGIMTKNGTETVSAI
jgi:hypothetical protein